LKNRFKRTIRRVKYKFEDGREDAITSRSNFEYREDASEASLNTSRRLDEEFFDDEDGTKSPRRAASGFFHAARSGSNSRFAPKRSRDLELSTSQISDSNPTLEEVSRANPSSFMPAQLRESFE
jgi:hypothetical protein